MARLSRRAWLAGAGLVGLLLTGSGCLSPTLPLPPPDKPAVTGPDAQGNVELRGGVQPGATATAVNPRTGDVRGQITGSNGLYDFTIPARVGDQLEFRYEIGNDISPSIVFMIQ